MLHPVLVTGGLSSPVAQPLYGLSGMIPTRFSWAPSQWISGISLAVTESHSSVPPKLTETGALGRPKAAWLRDVASLIIITALYFSLCCQV